MSIGVQQNNLSSSILTKRFQNKLQLKGDHLVKQISWSSSIHYISREISELLKTSVWVKAGIQIETRWVKNGYVSIRILESDVNRKIQSFNITSFSEFMDGLCPTNKSPVGKILVSASGTANRILDISTQTQSAVSSADMSECWMGDGW